MDNRTQVRFVLGGKNQPCLVRIQGCRASLTQPEWDEKSKNVLLWSPGSPGGFSALSVSFLHGGKEAIPSGVAQCCSGGGEQNSHGVCEGFAQLYVELCVELPNRWYSKERHHVWTDRLMHWDLWVTGNCSLLNWTPSFKIVCLRLEQDIKKLKADLQASRQIEQELRSQISSLTNTERGIRSEIGQLRQENELLQNK